MKLSPLRLRQTARIAAVLSMVFSALRFGLALPRPSDTEEKMVFGLGATLMLGLGILAFRAMVRRFDLRLIGPARAVLETVALALNSLLPHRLIEWATLIPGLGLLMLTQAAWARSQRQKAPAITNSLRSRRRARPGPTQDTNRPNGQRRP
ncbi:hypothetical protein FGG78_19620 [Thioclava sp. BHET1]|nr:hypothetical protein FGG78_19620 [Thioclava sp. BHET1]